MSKPSDWDLGAFPITFPGYEKKPISNTFHMKEVSYKTGYNFFKREYMDKFEYQNKYKDHPAYKQTPKDANPDRQ